ncbi:amino acid adenylation domain-containing protein [Marinobacter sp. HN1S83]|uniref:amino acid adenylation domain-containing protein n=1 Tax=Marinobacter sp. HN1S83 TaxID=3382301 RepID=UPI00387B0B93
MSIPTLLHECWTRGITLSANGDQLAFRAPPGALDDALKDRLREHKTAILAELAGQAETGQTDYFAPRPLGANERSLWFLYRMAPTSCAYNLAYAARLQPGVTAATVERAFNVLQQRHPILCSPYGERDGDAVQWLDTGHPPRPLDRRSFSGESEQDIRVYLAREADRPLALESGEVCRALLASNAREDGDQHYLLLVVHHIAADFASFEQLLAEFVDLAGGESAAEPGNPDTSGYRAWVAEQSRVIRDEGEEHGDYWRQQLEDAPGLELPTDFPHPAQQTFEGEELSFTLPSSDSRRLREAARSLGVTPYIYWLALFQWFLGRLSGQRDFVIGTPSSGRLTPELHALVGYLVNPVPLRCRLDDDLTLADWVRRVQRQATEALGYQAYPFATLVEQLQLGRETGRAPVFQHMFTLNRERSLPGRERVIARELMAEQRGAAHELNLVVVDRDDGFLGKWRYNRALYRRTTVAQLRELFLDLVRRSVNNLDQPLADLQWLPEALAGQLTGPRTQWPQPGAWEAFVHQVRTRPDALAIHELPPSGEGEQQLSYGELAARVNGCGWALQDRGLAVGDRVALCLPRGLPWVTALLATWQQGASYVALDPKWPAARLAWTCEDASPQLVVGLGERPDWLPPSVQWLDATAGWRAQPGELVARTDPSAPAYVIYTSGSTGRPKGVVVSQGSLLQYSQAVMERLQLPGDASLASLAGVATDLGYTALFGALLTGRTLRLLDEDLAFDAEGLADQLEQAPVDCLKLVPSHLKALLIASRPARLLPRRCLVCGGEALTRELVDQARSLVAELRIVNHYGPTEATVGAITYEVPNPAPETLPIGQPLANVTASVRNPRGELLPRGISGELYLAGATLAEGYLNRSQMTAKAFVRSERGEVLYRTGDRVSIDRNGQLRFIGRVDHQVKIRGYRVEPGEVANTVKAQPGVRDAVVVNRPDSRGQNRLVAYLVCDEAAMAPVREALAAILPDYMVPAVWIPLPGLPLKDNGKVDSSALPDPDQQEPAEAADDAGDASEDGVVGTLLAITRELLGNDSISATDNFFAVGGDSILSLQIIARAKQQGLQLTPKQIFEHQTMAALAQVVERTGESPVASAEPDVPQDGPFALTPIQQWFFEQDQPRAHHWNQSLLLRQHEPLQENRLREAVARLLQRHASLRLYFEREGDQWQQRYAPYQPAMAGQAFAVDQGTPDMANLQAWQGAMALDQAPLFRLVYFPASGHLLCTAHHLVVDAVSWQTLTRDLEGLYLAGPESQPPQPPAGASFQAWSRALQQRAEQPDLSGQLDYWRQQLEELPELPAQANRYADSRTLSVTLDAETTTRLLGGCHEAYNTQAQDLLLAALARVIGHWLGQGRVTIELESHGRSAESWAPDISRTPGWFTSRYPLAVPVSNADEAAVVSAKEALRSVPELGVGYDLLRYRQARDLPRAELITFNYLGQFDHWDAESRLFRVEEWACPGARAPENHRTHWLDVNALVLGGCLKAEWRYAPAVHGEPMVRELAEAFIREVAALVEHCGNPGAGRATASDFPDAGLSDDELQGLLDVLDQ